MILLRLKHAYNKLDAHLVYFKFAGMSNFMSLNELINQVRREIIKAGPLTPSTFKLKVLLAEILMTIEAYHQFWKELDQVESALADGKYREVAHGWHLYTQIKSARMTSIFKTCLFPEQLKVI